MTHGTVITFYSYKGGTGRSMALANIGLCLAEWGYRTLLVDWDLEAPGLESFFADKITTPFTDTFGVIDLLINKQLSWEKATISIGVEKGTLDLIKSGMKDENYFNNVSSLNFECYYKEGGGEKIEELRNEWINNYDFVLIDSRTGITDIGGVCTIHLPDIVVLMFTPTKQAIDGIVRVSKKAAQAQKELPYDRQRLFFVPIINPANKHQLHPLSLLSTC